MRKKWIAGVAALAALGGTAATATAVLGDGDTSLGAAAADAEVTVEVAGGGDARASSKTKLIYPLTPAEVIPASDNTTISFTVSSCPPGSKVVNASFDTDRQLTVLESSHPFGKREWVLRITEANSTVSGDYTAQFGLVCALNRPD